MQPGLYLVVEFDWPRPFQPGHGKFARQLHDSVQGQTWIKEVVAASGGLGSGPASLWIFWLENYAAFDRLLRGKEEAVSQAYTTFFSEMVNVSERVRDEVIFI